MMLLISAVYLISQLTVYSKAMETEHTIVALGGATIRLKCTGSSEMYYRGQWRVPVDTFKDVLFYDGTKKNPSINLTNVNLEVDNATRNYDLVIFNLTTQNVGVYKCILANSTNGPVSTKRFRVLIGSTDADTHSESQTYKQLFSPIFGGISGGICFPLVFLALYCYYTKRRMVQDFQSGTGEAQYDDSWTINYNSSELHTSPYNNEVRQTEHNTSNSIQLSEENSEQEESLESVIDDVDNSNGSSNTEAFSIETSGYENPYQSLLHDNSSEDHPYCGFTINQKINDTGLNYSEILHEPVPSSGIGVIHGTDDRVVYLEIDHPTIISKTDKTKDEKIYENDSTDFEK